MPSPFERAQARAVNRSPSYEDFLAIKAKINERQARLENAPPRWRYRLHRLLRRLR